MSNYKKGPEFSYFRCDFTEEDFEFRDLAKYPHTCWCEHAYPIAHCKCDCHEDLNPRGIKLKL